MKIGVYQIRNIGNNDLYVGSTTISFKSRWSGHRRLLRSNKHHSIHLQRAWNKYGEESFVFEVLTTCPQEYCPKLEQWFLDSLEPRYNIKKKAINSGPFQKNYSEKSTKANRLIGLKKRIPVYQYSLEGEFIKAWSYCKEAALCLKLHESGIYSAAIGKTNTASGFQWRFDKLDSIASTYKGKVINRDKSRLRQYYKFNIKGDFIEIITAEQAVRELGCLLSVFYKCLKNGRPIKGFVFSKNGEFKLSQNIEFISSRNKTTEYRYTKPNLKGKGILKLDDDFNIIETFDSYKDVDMTPGTLSYYILNNKPCKGFYYKYKDIESHNGRRETV